MRTFRWLWILMLGFFLCGCAKGGTHLVRIQYQPMKEFPSLSEKIGSTMGIAPIQDERPEQLYVGRHTPYEGSSTYFKSDPFPLTQALTNSLSHSLSRLGIKVVPVSHWDGKPESLRAIEADSILRIEIKRFWTEGRAGAFRSTANTSVHLLIHLGVRREGKVFTRNVEVEKEGTYARLTPKRVEAMVNQALTDIFDSFFSNPY